MADVFTPEKRSQVMAAIRGKDTKPEVFVRSELHKQGLRFRKNDKRYPGKPDVLLPKYKTAVFVNGCFWHAHEGCDKFKMPKSRVSFWTEKFERNRARDKGNIQALEEMGWNVITVWNCELSGGLPDGLVERIKEGSAFG